jgi:hypothetical protein
MTISHLECSPLKGPALYIQIPFNGMNLLKEITSDYCEMRKQPSHQEGTGFVTRQSRYKEEHRDKFKIEERLQKKNIYLMVI